ncbi:MULTISPECIES: hypothetical protein [Vibrio]|uniref:hypothetical protein n=1 Tax=Vibrio TaxID=662 RepID=UPI0021D1E7BE|nr:MULTISPECIES: hypothetical protein [Vibrio]MDW1552887.1 hypothetical protein [Vibrio sp. YT-18]MDW1900677.1 hypothetical protein [Vibrio sp. Vb1337]WNW05071.1 hypothetical protein RO483_08855 [Vibrio alginolyticus]
MKQSFIKICVYLKHYCLNLGNELRFFGVFGFISSLLMEVMALLPNHINRGLFSTLVGDHIPFYTLVSVFLVQFLGVVLYQFITCPSIEKYLDELVKHLSERIEQLSLPAISVILGMAFGSLFMSLFKGALYVNYAKFFALYALLFFFIALLSSQLRLGVKFEKGDIKREFCKIIGISIPISVVFVTIFNSNPMAISYEVSVEQYKVIEKYSDEMDIPIDEISRKFVLDAINQEK